MSSFKPTKRMGSDITTFPLDGTKDYTTVYVYTKFCKYEDEFNGFSYLVFIFMFFVSQQLGGDTSKTDLF